jgi:beta-lactamase class A
MTESRRTFLAGGLAAAALSFAPRVVHARSAGDWIVREFGRLPGRKGFKIWAPGVRGGRAWSVSLNPDQVRFCASSFKVFVLAEFLRQMEAGTVSLAELLPVDDSVWSLGSPVLARLPGTVTGRIRAQTALEAMIAHSDNTGTDMALKRVGADRVRQFIASIGLKDTRIPNSTRQFFGYIAGAPNWQTITRQEVLQLIDGLTPDTPIVNAVQTMASTPNDFVSFYSRALQGEFFAHEGTLRPFRAILAQADAIALTMPLGVNAFLKGGSIDFGTQHALSIAGGMFIPDRRWVYYSFMINWLTGEGGDVAEAQGPFSQVLRKIFTWIRDEFRRA